jgi:predicted membrane metal-binding protein
MPRRIARRTRQAASQVAAVCGAIALRRTARPANPFALAWLVVLIVKPTDAADTGCQLSFLCVAVLTWEVGKLAARNGRRITGRKAESAFVRVSGRPGSSALRF